MLNIVAKDLEFDVSEFSARSGSTVTVNFTNNDDGVPHDVTFAQVHGNTCSGPCTDHYTFTAPAPGSYQFFCSLHPNMVGSFIVIP